MKLGFKMFKNVNFIKVSLFSRFLKIFYKMFNLKQFAYFYYFYLYFSIIYPLINRRTVTFQYRISCEFTDYFNVKTELFKKTHYIFVDLPDWKLHTMRIFRTNSATKNTKHYAFTQKFSLTTYSGKHYD